MTKSSKPRVLLVSALATLMSVTVAAPVIAAEGASVADKGKAIAFNRKKGSCVTCHMMDDGASPGNLGPPLIAMKARYPDKAKLRAQIYDATVANPDSTMVPFGRHKVLTDAEIDKVVEYVWTL